ncbi:nickel/cobalt transporter [Frigidibacter sp. ROC022]|uniref:nickel/cobalt transporter n=1 Tax=Frigidibacter sp. ROC022 TaxID=2971796 RepID=UPI00215A4E4F|nr:hypothetical protein [Frigidibacter sp. ROC022]MCR8723029.1 hypothetical protein [Frigidibacter sp. ROC022]
MRRGLIALALVLVLGLLALWLSGGFDRLALWTLAEQRAAQGTLARGLRALRAGQPGALTALMAVAFTYGFVHAVGPGHGKMLIAGYGVGRQVGAGRLVAIALAASLAQAAVAVPLVHAGIWILGWGRTQLADFVDVELAQLGQAAVLALGLWLIWRGLRHLARLAAGPDKAAAGHVHAHAHDHAHCGHAHLPDARAISEARSWREIVLLVLAVAIRPCSGAVLILVLTWQMGIAGAGIAATFVMGLGTASVIALIALMSVGIREGALAGLGESRALALAVPVLELAVGLVVAGTAALLLARLT